MLNPNLPDSCGGAQSTMGKTLLFPRMGRNRRTPTNVKLCIFEHDINPGSCHKPSLAALGARKVRDGWLQLSSFCWLIVGDAGRWLGNFEHVFKVRKLICALVNVIVFRVRKWTTVDLRTRENLPWSRESTNVDLRALYSEQGIMPWLWLAIATQPQDYIWFHEYIPTVDVIVVKTKRCQISTIV